MFNIFLLIVLSSLITVACSDSKSPDLVNLNISPKKNADAGSSYENRKTDIFIAYSALPVPPDFLRDAVAYLDANNDGITDVFIATGKFTINDNVDSVLAINDGNETFTASTAEFNDHMPPANHARKAIVSDFTNNGLQDIFVFDHGYDADPFPGNQPKLILQNKVAEFSWKKLTEQTGFHHGGAAADIDNDGDIDIFVGGFQPFFYINDGTGNFTKVDNRFDRSIKKVFTAELIDVDQDGYVDLLVGAHEREGDLTAIYWGSSTGAYSITNRTFLPDKKPFGAILDFLVEDFTGNELRDIVINRTRDGNDGDNADFYQGSTVQLLINHDNRNFKDETNKRINLPGGAEDEWFPWLRVQDYNNNGFLDFGPDDAGRGFIYINDGTGNFIRTDL